MHKRGLMITHNGKEYARVSDVIAPYSDFSGIPDHILDRKKLIGTTVHKAISDHTDGEFCVLGEKEQPYFDSYLAWENYIDFDVIKSEERYFDDEKMLSGQIDAILNFPGESLPMLVDYKTSSKESVIAWPMQAHLYRYLLKDIPLSHRMLFVKLSEFGGFPVIFEYIYDEKIHRKCMKDIDLFWKNRKEIAKNCQNHT